MKCVCSSHLLICAMVIHLHSRKAFQVNNERLRVLKEQFEIDLKIKRGRVMKACHSFALA